MNNRTKIYGNYNYSSSTASISEQTFVVEYIVGGQMCDDCRRVEANDTWNASVQVRQKGGQRKTLFYLEQLLIKYEATRQCSAIKPNAEGLDFFFGSESGARKLVEFLSSVVPIRSQHAKRLVSHDANSNTFNYKYTTSVEIVPICKVLYWSQTTKVVLYRDTVSVEPVLRPFLDLVTVSKDTFMGVHRCRV